MLNNQIIESFVEEYMRSKVCVETTIRSVMKSVQEQECIINKDFTEFTKDEILNMYKQLGAISINSLLNRNLIVSSAYRWIFYTKGVNRGSIYDTINKDDLRICLDVDKKKSMLLNKQQIEEVKSELLNETDKAIIALLFEGVGGTSWANELTYLEYNNISRQEHKIYFKTGKVIDIDDDMIKLLDKSAAETEMLSYNNASSKVSKVIPRGIVYKERCNAIKKNDNQFNEAERELRYRWVQRRLNIIGEYLGFQKLTVKSLHDSGLLHYIKKGMDETGLDMRGYLKTEVSSCLAKRYDIYSNLYSQIILSKFTE